MTAGAVKLAQAIVDGGHVIPLERIHEVAQALLSLHAENERLRGNQRTPGTYEAPIQKPTHVVFTEKAERAGMDDDSD